MQIGKKFLNLLERAGSTFAEQFLTVLLGSGAASLLISPNWASAADRAGFAAVISVGTSLLTFGIPKLPDGIDAILRVLKTGLQVMLGDLLASSVTPSLVHADWRHALAAGVTVMGPAALKVIGSLGIPTTLGASVLPASLDHGALVDASLIDYALPAETDQTEVVVPPHAEADLANNPPVLPNDPSAEMIDPADLIYDTPNQVSLGGQHAAS